MWTYCDFGNQPIPRHFVYDSVTVSAVPRGLQHEVIAANFQWQLNSDTTILHLSAEVRELLNTSFLNLYIGKQSTKDSSSSTT